MNSRRDFTPGIALFVGALLLVCCTILATGGITRAASPSDGTEPLPPGTSVEVVLSNMNNPVAMAFDPAGRLFYTEKQSGQVRLFANGTLQATPVITFSVDSDGEQGLLGIAIDP